MPSHQPLSAPQQSNAVEAQPDDRLLEIYRGVKYLSVKHSSYFRTYETLFATYVGKKITFVEVGILNGGSLFMWRKYLGPDARIIGVDLNPAAKKWAADGFEIFIGDQSDPLFWQRLFLDIGPIDILLDDGGHTNQQQIETLIASVPHVKDGGLVVVEDTHCSYFVEFGNPSRHSFIEYAKKVIDYISSRNPQVVCKTNDLRDQIVSVRFFESIVAFEIDRRLCGTSIPTSNEGVSMDAKDFRYDRSWAASLISILDAKLPVTPVLWRLKPYIPRTRLLGLEASIQNWKLRRFFK